MRIMKARKKLSHNILIAEVKKTEDSQVHMYESRDSRWVEERREKAGEEGVRERGE